MIGFGPIVSAGPKTNGAWAGACRAAVPMAAPLLLRQVVARPGGVGGRSGNSGIILPKAPRCWEGEASSGTLAGLLLTPQKDGICRLPWARLAGDAFVRDEKSVMWIIASSDVDISGGEMIVVFGFEVLPPQKDRHVEFSAWLGWDILGANSRSAVGLMLRGGVGGS